MTKQPLTIKPNPQVIAAVCDRYPALSRVLSCTSLPRTLPSEPNRTATANGSAIAASGVDGALAVPVRPHWALVPPLLCLYLEDMVTLACAAATASTDDSELLELQEAGVMMLTEVVRIFAQVT